jgi:hypothetical protein
MRPGGWSETVETLQLLLEAWRVRWRPGEGSMLTEPEKRAMAVPLVADGLEGPKTKIVAGVFRRATREGWA